VAAANPNQPAAGVVPFAHLASADLYVDRIYQGGSAGNLSDDPLQRLLPVGNQGGFRYTGSQARGGVRVVVLYTTGTDPEWPDTLDPFTGTFTYFGDNKAPGRELHDTQRRGNSILRDIFELAHGSPADRALVPPVLVFSRAGQGRDVVFRGLAVPGAPTLPPGEDLVSLWRVRDGRRFQNYRATFTILDEATVSRAWLNDILTGNAAPSTFRPRAWGRWAEAGAYSPLITQRVEVRSREEQRPITTAGIEMVQTIHRHFAHDPHRFEARAVEIWRRCAPSTSTVDLTRPYRDGGRDAVGTYLLGPPADRLAVEFALEAKCYAATNAVGVRDMSRLISRLRHRQFGVFVTTSIFNAQAYEEVRLDNHPVVLIAARDIVDILTSTGIPTPTATHRWLTTQFPHE
jgi:hypothetical protein